MIKGLFLVLFVTLISSLIFALLILTSYFVFLLIYGEISERKSREVKEMTKKYINAKDLLNEAWAEAVEGRIYDGNTYVGTFNVVPIGDITEIVNHMPSADVVEVKHGEWIEKYGVYKCSCCNENSLIVCDQDKETFEYLSDFCPNCGADMREGKESNG